MPAPLLQLVRRTLYRPHIENGLSVAVGVAVAGVAVGWFWGLAAGIAASTGALCASVADQPDPVPDTVWEKVAKHFSQPEIAALLVDIAQINSWNRFNVAVRMMVGEKWEKAA